MYDSILVPVDGSETSERAVDHASGLAREQNADLELFNVFERAQLAVTTGASLGTAAEPEAVFREEAEETVATAAERVPDGIDVETDVAEGTPSTTIAERAAEADIDLVVMGTHGRRGLTRVFLGSTTERTVRMAPVPVLTVNPPAE